MTFKRNFNHRS